MKSAVLMGIYRAAMKIIYSAYWVKNIKVYIDVLEKKKNIQ